MNINPVILPYIGRQRTRLTLILGLLTLFSCGPTAPATPICRTIGTPLQTQVTAPAAACLIRLGDSVLLLRPSTSGLLALPSTTKLEGESLRCAAHRATWQYTGFNVAVGRFLTYSSTGTAIFQCQGAPSMQSLAAQVSAPPWALYSDGELVRVSPFSIEHRSLANGADLTPLRDAFVAAKRRLKEHRDSQ